MGKWAQKLEKELAYGDTTTKQTRTNAVKAISHLGIFAFYPYNSTTHRNHRISYQQLQMVQDDICHLWQTHICFSRIPFFYNFNMWLEPHWILNFTSCIPAFKYLLTIYYTYTYTQINKQINKWMNEWMNIRVYIYINKQIHKYIKWKNKRTNKNNGRHT
jgi:hypothetical protein